MNLIEATKKAILNGIQENKNLKNEEVDNKILDVSRIKNWAKKSIDWLIEQDQGCCEYKLDNDLSIFCGWSDGYDPADDGIKPKEDLTFRINIGIKGNHEYMKTDYDWLVAPYDDKTGDVWDTDITVSPEGVSDDDIQWLINQYKEIRQALDDNDIMLENYEDEDGRFLDDNTNYDIYVDDRYPEEIQEQYKTYAIEELSNGEEPNNFDDWIKIEYPDVFNEIEYGLDENKKQEARSHKEDNEKVAPRTTTRNGKEVKITDIQKDLDNTFVGKRYAKGAVANNPYYGGQYYGTTDAEYRSKRNKTGQKRTSTIDMSKKYDVYKADTFETPVTNYQSAMNRYKSYEETGDEDTPIAQSYKKSAQDIVNKERERIANKSTENKKITEATLDLDDMYDEYKKAYNKDLDTKRVPCVIARDVMLSGWGGAEGKNHYQVVLCADTVEARNIEYNMRAKAKQEQLANVRTSIGIQLPRNASVAYTVGRNAPAWNMGDSWYESRFGKVEEGRYKLDVVKYNMLHDKFKNDKRSYDELSDDEKKELDTYRDLTKKVYNSTRDHKDIKSEAKDNTKIAEIEKQIKSKLKSYKQLKKINKGDTNKSKDLEDEIEDLEAQLKSLKSEAIETQDIQAHTTAGDTDEERAYYGKNLTKRNKIRSLDQAKRNLDRANNGDERVQAKQVYDQVSYDNLPDTDLQTYKFRKDMASIHSGKGPKYNKDLTVDGKSKLEPSEHNDMVATMWDIQANNVADKIRAKHIKKEARNPENDKVNAMIRTTLNGSTKYVKDLEDLGFVLDKYGPNGKVSTIHHKDNDEYLYRGKMMGLDKNADLYNYLTKKRPTDWDDRTNSGFEVQKNMSSEKDLADGGYSSNGFTSTVGKSIPKRFKTNKSSIVVTEPYGSKKVKQYKELNKNIAYKKDDIADLQNDVTSMQNDIAKKQNDINSTQDEINQMEEDKKALLTKQKA